LEAASASSLWLASAPPEADPPPEPPEPDPLTVESTCEDWHSADATAQREFAEPFENEDLAVVEFLGYVSNFACTEQRRAFTIQEAVDDETGTTDRDVPDDEFSETRISGAFAKEIAASVRRSWNKCADGDVCIPGTRAKAVGCSQPDPQVMELECFVTTKQNTDGTRSGFTVDVTVTRNGRYSWGLSG
jgi:hypothetical protein